MAFCLLFARAGMYRTTLTRADERCVAAGWTAPVPTPHPYASHSKTAVLRFYTSFAARVVRRRRDWRLRTAGAVYRWYKTLHASLPCLRVLASNALTLFFLPYPHCRIGDIRANTGLRFPHSAHARQHLGTCVSVTHHHRGHTTKGVDFRLRRSGWHHTTWRILSVVGTVRTFMTLF